MERLQKKGVEGLGVGSMSTLLAVGLALALPMLIAMGLAILLLAGCDETTTTEEYTPGVTAADFVSGVDNPFFPLNVGDTWSYRAETEDGLEEIEVEVLDETVMVWGVEAMVVRDTVFLDGELVEDTWDWYAQDQEGNVWYLGEDTFEYEDGEVVSTEGAWEAGVDGALPGIVMKADPQLGEGPYYQEYLPGEAEDQGEVIELDVAVEVQAGSFTGCIRTRDFTPLEPDVEEFKTYCEGIGVVLEEEEGFLVELVDFSGLP